MLQRGLIGGLGLRPPEDRVILPHEDVMPGPVTGRRELMEATQANLEPIFLLYDGGRPPGAATQVVEAVAAGGPPLAEALTEDGLRHRLWAVTDPAQLAAVAADLAPRQALIADGHHRYAAYRQLQARRRDAGCGAGPWDYGLALLVDSAAYPPRIGAIHRVLPGLTPDKAVDLAKGAFCVTPQPGGSRDLAAALAALDQAAVAGPAFLVAGASAAENSAAGEQCQRQRHRVPADRPGPGAGRGGHAGRAVGDLARPGLRGAPAAADHPAMGAARRRPQRPDRAQRRGHRDRRGR